MESQKRQIDPGLILVALNEEEQAAVEGWRRANACESREDAVRQLVRLGLLHEIGRIYQESSKS